MRCEKWQFMGNQKSMLMVEIINYDVKEDSGGLSDNLKKFEQILKIFCY